LPKGKERDRYANDVAANLVADNVFNTVGMMADKLASVRKRTIMTRLQIKSRSFMMLLMDMRSAKDFNREMQSAVEKTEGNSTSALFNVANWRGKLRTSEVVL
jgi:transcriptional regulatory protein LevR